MTSVLVGFNEFGGLAVNPARLVVEELALRRRDVGARLVTEILPTEFATAGERVLRLIRGYRPDVFTIIGVAGGRNAVNLERVALNLDDTDIDDNVGVRPEGRLIIPDGPLAYFTTFPLLRLHRALYAREIPVQISNHAGTFVCNHVLYLALHELAQLVPEASCGLIHIPFMTEQIKAGSLPAPSLPITRLVEAVEVCLAECERTTGQVFDL